jgi:hypothetical protein
VQQPAQQPSHRPLRYFVQVEGRWASTLVIGVGIRDLYGIDAP